MNSSNPKEESWITTLNRRYAASEPLFGPDQVAEMIPHRDPFLVIDDIVEFDRDRARIVGRKKITDSEDVLRGHFPGAPIFPGVLIIEALAQTGGVLIHQMGYKGKIPVIIRLEKTTFRRPVFPEAVLFTVCESIHLKERGGRMRTYAVVGERACAFAEIGFALVDASELRTRQV